MKTANELREMIRKIPASQAKRHDRIKEVLMEMLEIMETNFKEIREDLYPVKTIESLPEPDVESISPAEPATETTTWQSQMEEVLLGKEENGTIL